MHYGSSAHQSTIIIWPCPADRPRNPPSSMVRSAAGLSSWCGVSPLEKWACGPYVDEGDGRAKRHAFLLDEPSAGHKGDRLMTCAHGLGGPCYGCAHGLGSGCYWRARTASEDRVTGVRARPRRAMLRGRNQTLVAVDHLRREASVGIGLAGALVQSHAVLSVRRCGRFEA